MNAQVKTEGTKAYVEVEGRLDTMSVPQLEQQLGEISEDVDTYIFDFEKLSYISSAGLRVLLATKKKAGAKQGDVIVRNVNEFVMEVFEATGFTDVLTIE